MQNLGKQIKLSASDLANHLACRHLTNLNLALAEGKIKAPRPADTADEIEALIERGERHEQAYLDYLQAQHPELRIYAGEDGATMADTERAMREGVDIIVQAALEHGRWRGHADLLRKVERPSELGAWSYEAADTKLARETKAGTVLQIALYSHIVGKIQGATPEFMHVVSPGLDESAPFQTETFRTEDYFAYYRLMRSKLEEAVGAGSGRDAQEIPTYPEPVPHCDVCRWRLDCGGRRRRDDHLSLVAELSASHQQELQSWGIRTLAELAKEPLPFAHRPKHGSIAPYERAREQARVQLEGRERGEPYHELRRREPERGFARLPEPSPGDIFFAIEGSPFVGTRGLEYLFGWAAAGADGKPEYHGRWAFGMESGPASFAAGECAVFEEFIDFAEARRKQRPDLHIYHFGAYEPSALKRLMCRYATREEEVDNMLRAELFIDLRMVVRQAVWASVERYSIRELEQFYGYGRETNLHEANDSRHHLERLLETGRIQEMEGDPETRGIVEKMRSVVQAGSRDDCLSALRLRDWLEELRHGLVKSGEAVPRPAQEKIPEEKELSEHQLKVKDLKERLLEGLEDGAERSDEEEARWLAAHLLDWHRREAKSKWWECFRLAELGADELRDEKAGLTGLAFLGSEGGTERAPIHRYRFEMQDTAIRAGDTVHQLGGERLGAVEEIDHLQRTIAIKKRGSAAAIHPPALYAADLPIRTDRHEESLLRIGAWIADNGVDAPAPAYRAARDLLLARPPRLSPAPASGAPLQGANERPLEAAKRLALRLDHGLLPIQGPPGTGKTFTAARMICELVRKGKKVGVTANSHSVIRNLLDAAVKAAAKEKLELRCMQKVQDAPKKAWDSPIKETDSNAALLRELAGGQVQVGAGTSWVWARSEFAGAVDVLFIDEAGQMSLANALAVAPAAANLVLLGDPQQLEQPQQGSHPEGADASALERLLDGRRTIPDDRGIFLGETYRMHPAICAFTSELFYDKRLTSRPELANQAIRGAGELDDAGLRLIPVAHQGNQSASVQEAERVAELYSQLLHGGAAWTDQSGQSRPLTKEDILIVAPYNAHLAEIGKLLPRGARFGTVDKFQGQEAPVLIYSMATSSPEEAPRGMEFLYSLNRLNVATSRARCVSALVASPLLFEPECKTPRQMQLANALCRYLEMVEEQERLNRLNS